MKIRTVVSGAMGKMGQVLAGALLRESDIELVGGVDVRAKEGFMTLEGSSAKIPISSNLDSLLASVRPNVLADFTVASAVLSTVRTAVKYGVNLVVGTTGLKDSDVKEIGELAKANNVGAMVAPNFALGAVLMMHMAKIASKYLDSAEIIELHHDQKLDAPSGTALATAKMMAEVRGKPFQRPPAPEVAQPSRGQLERGITLHSVRLPGYVAHQEVIFGGLGQTLTIRHDTTGRESFLPGIILAIKEIGKRKGLIYGLDVLLGL